MESNENVVLLTKKTEEKTAENFIDNFFHQSKPCREFEVRYGQVCTTIVFERKAMTLSRRSVDIKR